MSPSPGDTYGFHCPMDLWLGPLQCIGFSQQMAQAARQTCDLVIQQQRHIEAQGFTLGHFCCSCWCEATQWSMVQAPSETHTRVHQKWQACFRSTSDFALAKRAAALWDKAASCAVGERSWMLDSFLHTYARP